MGTDTAQDLVRGEAAVLAGVGSACFEGAELGVVGVEALKAMEEGESFGGVA